MPSFDSVYISSFMGHISESQSLNRDISHRFFHSKNNIRGMPSLIIDVLNSDRVILHGMFSPFYVAMFATIPGLAQKSKWMVWGADLYDYYLNEGNHSQLKAIVQKFRVKLIRKLGGIGSLPYGDYEFARTVTGTESRYQQVFYKPPVDFRILMDNSYAERHPPSSKTILLGNSASRTNNHIQALEWIKNRDDGKVEIICPLSYGDECYGNEVSRYGVSLFGDRFHALREFCGPADYSRILHRVDAAIFNHDRQQALGNIIALLFLGKKVYLKRNVSTYSLLNDMGITVGDSCSLEHVSDMDEIFRMDEFERMNNIKIVEEFFSDDNFDRLWHRFLTE